MGANDLDEVVNAILDSRPAPPHHLERSVSEELSTLAMELLEPEIAYRPANSGGVIARLRALGPSRCDPALVRAEPQAAPSRDQPPMGSCTIEITPEEASAGGGS